MHPYTDRLNIQVSAVCPHYGATPNTSSGTPSQVRIDYRPEATAEQRAAAQSVVDAFDWSEQAHAAWEANRNPEKRDLLALVAAHVADLNQIIGAASFTNAQRDAALRKLAQGQKAIIKRLVQLQ